ncbi:hypothetical protein C8034_v010934 [Colletotrichum sidae]|uniref:F-box domain-containing protein n=1 Tax=Colletotrichum sidae TaxID=1347389 RepID=A0A4R8TJX5_9PEZI|nr:hypothetical protein C8034_v010934 [Colletotrichum sidae]
MPLTIGDLPNEILAQVFTHLDRPAPSDSRLHDQPSSLMLQNIFFDRDLKTTSTICKRWRGAVLPLLFRHVLWTFDRFELSLMEETGDPTSAIDLLVFLRANNLTNYVTTLTIVVHDAMSSISTHGASAVELMETGYASKASYSQDYNWLWRTIFSHVDPVRLTLLASPKILAQLFSRMLFLGDAWNFDMPQHILSLSRKNRTVSTEGQQSARASTSSDQDSAQGSSSQSHVPCDLFTVRPWQALLLNEGSSTRVYKTYEYYLKRPPSILGAILGAEEYPNDQSVVPSTICDLSYVGIFPLSSHFNTLVQNMPRVDRLFVQLVPRNDILQDAEEMRNVDIADLWMERNTSYSMLFRELFDPDPDSPFLELKTFESGDAADREAWEMAVQFVQFSGVQGWKVESEGVFSPKCLKLCVSDDAATGTDGGPMTGSDVVVTKCGNEDAFCCGNDQEARECCEAGRGVRVVNGQVVAASSTMSTQPTSATSPLTSTPTPDNEAGGTTASQAAVIGGTVGAIIGVMTLAAVVVFLWLRGWKRKARMVQPTEPTQVVTEDVEDKNAAYDSMLPGSQHFDGPGAQYHLAELPEDHSQPGELGDRPRGGT